jgi:hypothetical protein
MVDIAVAQVQASSAPDRAALRAELDATRRAVLRLIGAVTASQWRTKSPACDWTMAEVFVHLTWALEYLPAEVARAKRGQGMFNMPKRLADPLSYWYMRWLARRAKPEAIARRYDAAMAAAIRVLNEVNDGDWALGAGFYGEGFHSVLDLFHMPAQHVAEHTAGLAQ